jgi:hypothetical protein
MYFVGPTWINLNWITILALEKYGHFDLSDTLRKQTLNLIAAEPTPREYYNPLNGSGLFYYNYMWTGALFIVMIQENQTQIQSFW